MNDATNARATGSPRPRGFGAFAMIWSSQILSILTSGMTGFALTIWMFEQTKSATAMAGMQLAFMIPFMVMSFFSGPMVDRYNRKLMMSLSDIGSAIVTGSAAIAFATGVMAPWMLYLGMAILGIGAAFQWPAFSATISLIVPKEQLGRVNGMMTLLEAGPAVFSPLLAGAALPFIGLSGILFLDLSTFVIALATLLFVQIPNPPRTAEGEKAKGNLVSEAWWGFRYIFERPSLMGMQLLLLAGNTFIGFAGALFAPMVLAKTGTDTLVFGSLQTIGAIGAVVGGIAISVWGGFKNKPLGVVVGWLLGGVFTAVFGFGGNYLVWAIAAALMQVFMPLVNASNQSLWQVKVAPDLQGRVFSARRMIAQVSGLVVPMIAGTLADFVFEPAMASGSTGGLASAFGPLFGSGPGAGMSVIIALGGLATAAAALVGWAVPCIRNAETLLPDAIPDAKAEPEPAMAAASDGGFAVIEGGAEEDKEAALETVEAS